MNYKIALLPLLVAGMLASCNSDEEIIQTNPNYVEAGYGALTVTLTNPGKGSTKAGEELTGVATDEEKTVKSVAFFVQTGNDEVGSETKFGKFGAYFSTEEPLSANGLQEELAEVSAGNYTAKIRHQSDGWGDPKVIVIANYAENGLTDVLKAVQRWDELASVQTLALTANPQTPLLMYATENIESWKSSAGSSGGGAAEATFELERLVSRIDIHNNAYVEADQSKGFVLTSACLVRSKVRSFLLPKSASIGSVDVATEAFPVSGTVAVDGGIQKLDTLYAYENPNDDASKATAVQINGTYRGGNISKIVTLKKADGVGTTGDPIPLARNTRYVININPAPDSTDITWNIQVKDWAESDTIKVKPVFPVPVLSDVDASAVTGAGMTWNETEKLITTTGTATATMTFKTIGTTASLYEVALEYDTDGSSINGKVSDIVEIGTPIITYAAQVETPFTVNVPSMKSDEAVPVDIHIIIQNGGNIDACDTLTIRRRPNYADTELQPVLMKSTTGKNFFWAPVNVGATIMPTSVDLTGDITSTCGKIFQWGRAFGFPASTDAVDTTGIGTTLGRPVQADLEDMTKWDNKYIYCSDKNPNTQKNWLLINGVGQDNPAGSGMVAGEWYQKLWNEGSETVPVKSAYDPCPAGWRVPTSSEWWAIGAGGQIADSWDDSAKLMSIPGVDGSALVLPAAGRRNSATGATSSQGRYGFYWSSSVSSGSTNASLVGFVGDAALNAYADNRANGYSVRCVQE